MIAIFSIKGLKRTLAPIWLPHWPAWRCTISRMSLAQLRLCKFSSSPTIREPVSTARRRSQSSPPSSSVFVTLEMRNAHVFRCTRADARTRREIKSWTRKISDATRHAIIPAKSLTLRIVTQVIWLNQTRVPMDTRREESILGSATVSGQLNVTLMNKRLTPVCLLALFGITGCRKEIPLQ